MVESSEITGLVKLKTIVANVMSDMNDYSPRGYNRLLNYAIRGIKELRLFAGGNNVKEVELDVSAVNVVTLPTDFLYYVEVGIPYRGRMWSFTKDGRLLQPTGEADGIQTYSTGESAQVGDNQFVSGYGVKGGRNSFYFKFDLQNNRMILNGVNNLSKVRLVYTSTGIDSDGKTLVPKVYEEAIIAYIHWRRKQHDPQINRADKQDAFSWWNDEYEKVLTAKSATLEEMMDAVYSSILQTIKR